MKKIIILVTSLFMFTLPNPVMAVEDSLFIIKMKNMGFRWTNNIDNLNDFWAGAQRLNSLRLFSTVYIGSESHQVRLMYGQRNISAPWDLIFQSRSAIDEQVMFEYQYNFDK